MGINKITGFRNMRLARISLALFGLFFIISWYKLDPDFGWHLVTGNYIRLHGIPYKDIYTYTVKGHRWVDFEWGNDLILSFLYGWGGFWLTSAFYSILWTLALLISGYRARFLVLLLAATALAPYAGTRTITWSALFFSITFALLEKRIRISAWILPPLFLFWANVHAGFIAGLALIAYFAIKDRNIKLFYVLLASFLVTFINPYGIGLYQEVARTLFDPVIHSQIQEWKRFYLPGSLWLFAVLWVVGYLISEKHKIKSLLNLPPLLFLAGLSATRNFPFFILGSVNKLDEYFKDAPRAIPKTLLPKQKPVKIIAYCLFGFILLETLYVAYGTVLVSHNRYYDLPVAAVNYLTEHRCEGNLFNDFNYGGYLIWKLPSEPDFIDGRMATWQPQMDQYYNIENKPAQYYPSVFAKYDIQCVLLSQSLSGRLIVTLEKNNWHRIINANDSILLEKY